MTQSRESIYAALFALGQSLTGIQTSGRRLQPWTKTPLQPALFQTQIREQPNYGQESGMPARWTLKANWWLYVSTLPNAGPPCAIVNGLIDQIEALFPGASPWNTLGGLVNRVRIDGEIKTDEGMLAPQAIAIVPLEIIAI